MTLLQDSEIVVVAYGGVAAEARARVLRARGANTTVCAPDGALWTTLRERVCDVIVVVAQAPDDAQARALAEQLRADAQARPTPVLIDVMPAAPGDDDDCLASAVGELLALVRKLRSAEQAERILREQLRFEHERVRRALRSRSELAHELRAMLGAVVGFACNLRDEIPGPLAPDQRAHVAGILEATSRAGALLERRSSLLPSPRPSPAPSSVPARAQRTWIQLSQLVAEVLAVLSGVAAQHGVRLCGHYDESVCLWGDGLRLKQLLTNLVVNAVNYGRQGGSVHIHVGWTSGPQAHDVEARRAAQLVVQDDGPGIAPELRERVFERGFRIAREGSTAGDGIGLALVREIARAHGGSARVEDGAGTGARFVIQLAQDRRQRVQPAALVLHEGHAAQALLARLTAAGATTLAPDDREHFIDLAFACQAVLLLSASADATPERESSAAAGAKRRGGA